MRPPLALPPPSPRPLPCGSAGLQAGMLPPPGGRPGSSPGTATGAGAQGSRAGAGRGCSGGHCAGRRAAGPAGSCGAEERSQVRGLRPAGSLAAFLHTRLSKAGWGILEFQPHQGARIMSVIAMDKHVCRAQDASSWEGKTALIRITCSP